MKKLFVIAALAALPFASFAQQWPTKPVKMILSLGPGSGADIGARLYADKLQKMWDYIYEPSAAELLDGVLMRYIESQVYQGAVENVACEMAARMVAMKSATDNAGKLIEELQLIYNKARQAAITKEISEIVGGAAAV